MKSPPRLLIALPLLLVASLPALPLATALAQGKAPPHPADAAASAPKAEHRSALAVYRRHAETQPKSWRDANDTVARIGGWRVYAREAAAADAPASGASR
jgi:hypothetical protein